MKKIILYTSLALLFGCSNDDETDQAMIDKDLEALRSDLDAEKVIAYKFCKIMMRASAERDTTSQQHKEFKKELDENFQRLMQLDKTKQLSVMDYLAIYKDYQNMRGYIVDTDEDIFPTLRESIPSVYGNPANNVVFLTGKAKQTSENQEHALLSALVLFSKDLGKEIALYECAETSPDLLEDSEFKSLMLFYRSFLFFDKGLYYLSESEATKNINWLNENPKADLKMTRSFLSWTKLNKDETRLAFLSMNHLFRGFDRMMMDRKIDEERSMQDFEKFIELSSQLGISNELTWSVETYVHLKKGENDKAIASLKKLEKSKLLSTADKQIVTESIRYLQNKQPGKVLNGVYDKLFITRIASSFVYNHVASINWEPILVKEKVPYAHKVMGTVNTLKTVSSSIEKHTSGESIEAAGKEIKEEGKSLWSKAKGLLD